MAAERRESAPGFPRTTTNARPVADHLQDLQIIPEDASALAALDRMIDRAMGFRASFRLMLVDDECEHGGLPHDSRPQAGCVPGCPGYPAQLRDAEPVAAPPTRQAAPQRFRRVGRELHGTCKACGQHFAQEARQGRPFTRCLDCRS